MNKLISKKIATAIAILGGAAFLSGCGNGSTPVITNPNTNLQYGLGQCLVNLIPASGQTAINTVSFTATGITQYPLNLAGGTIPLADNVPTLYGSTLMHGGLIAGTITVASGASLTTGNIVGQGVDGNLYVNSTTTSATSNQYYQTVNATGTFTFSSAKLSSIAAYAQLMRYNSPGINPIATPSILASQYCINGMAMDISYTTMGAVNGGRVYFYTYEPSYLTSTTFPSGYNAFAGNNSSTAASAGHGIIVQF